MPITCPSCESEAGFEAQPYWEHNNSLSLKGQLFKFTLFQKSSFEVSENTYCCILCGHVWAKANIKNLREVISRFGSEEMKKIVNANQAS